MSSHKPLRFRNRGYRPNYPKTVQEILDPERKYHPDALRALKRFRRSKPWQGDQDGRLAKLRILNDELSRVYRIDAPRLVVSLMGGNCYIPLANKIALCSKLSVVTFLHEFAHARGANERQAVAWSVNLFARIFPRSFARCRQVRHMLLRGGEE